MGVPWISLPELEQMLLPEQNPDQRASDQKDRQWHEKRRASLTSQHSHAVVGEATPNIPIA